MAAPEVYVAIRGPISIYVEEMRLFIKQYRGNAALRRPAGRTYIGGQPCRWRVASQRGALRLACCSIQHYHQP